MRVLDLMFELELVAAVFRDEAAVLKGAGRRRGRAGPFQKGLRM